MKDQYWSNWVLAIVAIVVVVWAGFALTLATPAGPAPATSSTSAQPATIYRNLTIAYDRSTGGLGYSATDFSVPLNVRVVFTITNFDTSVGTLPTAKDAEVTGTQGGFIAMTDHGASHAVTGLPANQIVARSRCRAHITT